MTRSFPAFRALSHRNHTLRFASLATAFLITTIAWGQGQLLDTDKPPETPVETQIDPLREATLTESLLKQAQQPLPVWSPETAKQWSATLTPFYDYVGGISTETVELAAQKYRRGRIRRTQETRQETKQPYRLLWDWSKHSDLLQGRPTTVHGYITELKAIPETHANWYLGRLKPWDDEGTVPCLINTIPEGFLTRDELKVPVTIVGYVFTTQASEGEMTAPLIVEHGIRWLTPELDPAILRDIKDRRLGVREEELDPYHRTLLRAAVVDQNEIAKLADEFWKERQETFERPRPLIVDLFKQSRDNPLIYRGKPITLTGTLRRLTVFPADPLNSYGFETLYEGWIYNEDSQSNPAVVVFTENTRDIPEGAELVIPVKVTGYLFKMYGYEAHDGKLRVAPMILAKTLQKQTVIDPKPFPIVWVGSVFVVLLAGIVLFAWSSHRKDREVQQSARSAESDDAEPPSFDDITEDENPFEGLQE